MEKLSSAPRPERPINQGEGQAPETKKQPTNPDPKKAKGKDAPKAAKSPSPMAPVVADECKVEDIKPGLELARAGNVLPASVCP